MDSDGYPTEDELTRIRTWPITNRFHVTALLQFVEPMFDAYGSFGFNDADTLLVSTGGWSGCEAAIHALKGNFMFWSLCWESSRRGGHYVFDLSRVPEPHAYD